jgi:phosphatidylinositol glycan class W
VTEYGVHWNFFFTLGLMPFFGALAVKLRRFMPYTIMALLLSSCEHRLDPKRRTGVY